MNIKAMKLTDPHDHPEPHTMKWTQLEMDYINKRVEDAVRQAIEQAEKQEPVKMVLPPITEPTVKSEPVYIMGSYVGTGKVASVKLGGVSFTGNGTAGREADVRPTGFFFQADKKQEPVGEVYGWHGQGVGQPLCRFNVTEADMPVGSLLYTSPPPHQPLTDEEIAKCYETTGHYQTLRPQDRFAVFALARAIEAKLKEKNA